MQRPSPDPRFMRRAFELALEARGRTHPNPCVGAVVVHEGEIAGECYHKGPGTAHAEVVALDAAAGRARGADLYVSLEPCCTYGRTPPCTQAIREAGIARVLAAVQDPNPAVDGAGARELREGGTEVVLGFLEAEGRSVDLAYHAYHKNRRPFVHLKWAQSLDGAVALPEGGYITGEEARRRVHEDRFLSDALLVSARTVRRDNPQLTVRLENVQKKLIRILLDTSSELTGDEAVFGTCPGHGPVWVIFPEGAETRGNLHREGVETLRAPMNPRGGFHLPSLMKTLYDRQVVLLYVEAVGRLSAAFLGAGLVDRLSVHISPVILGGAGPRAVDAPADGAKIDLSRASWESAGADWIVTADLEGACSRG